MRQVEGIVSTGWVSPLCRACRNSAGSESCFGIPCDCDNLNISVLPGLGDMTSAQLLDELKRLSAAGTRFSSVVLSCEGNLRLEEAPGFFGKALRLQPGAYTLLRAGGDLIRTSELVALARAGLQELRFSAPVSSRPVEGPIADCVSTARRFVPHVSVEVAASHINQDSMTALLNALEGRGCSGVNIVAETAAASQNDSADLVPACLRGWLRRPSSSGKSMGINVCVRG